MKSILTSILILFSVRVISQKAQMEILGALGNQTTVLTIGSDGTGISLQRNWPTIGFNQYRDAQNLQRFMGDGYAGSIFFSPVEGEFILVNSTMGLKMDLLILSEFHFI